MQAKPHEGASSAPVNVVDLQKLVIPTQNCRLERPHEIELGSRSAEAQEMLALKAITLALTLYPGSLAGGFHRVSG